MLIARRLSYKIYKILLYKNNDWNQNIYIINNFQKKNWVILEEQISPYIARVYEFFIANLLWRSCTY